MPSVVDWTIGVVVIMVLVLCIATASIGKECYNDNKLYGDDPKRKGNSNYLTAGIWAPIVAIFAIGGGLAFAQYLDSKNPAVGVGLDSPVSVESAASAASLESPVIEETADKY
jgi:hypothetical protein